MEAVSRGRWSVGPGREFTSRPLRSVAVVALSCGSHPAVSGLEHGEQAERSEP
jgi:hypothetical protein